MKKFLRLGLLCFALMVLGRLSAQTEVHALVTFNSGTTQDYVLDESCQISFGNEDYLTIIRPDCKEAIQIAFDDIRKITFEDTWSNSENNSQLSILPNPVENHFFINGMTEPTVMSIYSIDGRLVHHCTVENGQLVDTSDLDAGLYLVHIGSQILKMMKL